MSNVKVRYCSKTKMGNNRRIADAIAEGIGVSAVSIEKKIDAAKEFGKKFAGEI